MEKGNCGFGFTLEPRRRDPFSLYPSLNLIKENYHGI
jgi:hypothetical protein